MKRNIIEYSNSWFHAFKVVLGILLGSLIVLFIVSRVFS